MKQKTRFKILEISVSADISAHEWSIYRYQPQKKPYRSISNLFHVSIWGGLQLCLGWLRPQKPSRGDGTGLITFDLDEIRCSFKRDEFLLTLRFTNRFYNSWAQGVSSKNEKRAESPWRGAPRGAGPNAATSVAPAYGREHTNQIGAL